MFGQLPLLFGQLGKQSEEALSALVEKKGKNCVCCGESVRRSSSESGFISFVVSGFTSSPF